MAIVADNATNNDTMIEALEVKSKAKGISFNAKDVRCRCMPHTVHLAAMKVYKNKYIILRWSDVLYSASRRNRYNKRYCT